MESKPQNPEFRNNPENFHSWILNVIPFKPSVLFVGHRQTVQTQIRHQRTRRLIRVSTICLQKFLLEFPIKTKNTILQRLIRNWTGRNDNNGKFRSD